MAETNGAPGKDGCQARESHHPVESLSASIGSGSDDVAKKSEDGNKYNRDKGPTSSVNVAKNLGRLSLVCERGEGSGGAVDG